MAIDASIPLQTKTPDVIGKVGSLSDIVNKQNQARLFESEYDARQALGPIFQQSFDPKTGDFDMDKLGSLLANSPQAAFKAPEIMNQILLRKQTQLDVERKNLDNQFVRVEGLNKVFGSLAEMGDNVSYSDVVKHVGTLVAQIGDPKFTRMSAIGMADLPQGGPALAKALEQRLKYGLSQADQLKAKYGVIEKHEAGNRTLFNRINPTAQQPVETVGSVQQGLSPSEQVSTTDAPVAESGAPQKQFKGSVGPQPQGGVEPVGGTGAQAGGPGGASRGGPFPTELAPGQKQFEEVSGTEAGKYKEVLDSRVSSGQQIMTRMEENRKLLERIRTGGGSAIRLRAAKVAQAVGAPTKVVDAITGGDTGAAEEFNKFAVRGSTEDLKQTLAGSIGSKINMMEFDQFRKNNPNLETDPRAIEKIYNFTTKLYKMDSAEQKEFTAWKGKPRDWQSHWNQRAQELGFFKPEEREGYAKSIEKKPDNKAILTDIFGAR